MIRTSLVNGRLEINDVVLKDTFVLRNFKIVSVVDYPVTVALRSQISQIAFQESNENLPDADTEVPVQDDDFNQLFNEVNLVDRIVLPPMATKNIVMSFRPSALLNHDDETFLRNSLSTTDKFNNYFEVKKTEDITPSTQEMTIDFAARICRSLLKLDVNEIIFDDCVVGGSYVKDVTFWNKSEMPLKYSIFGKEKTISLFSFTDYVTGLPLSLENQSVPSYSSTSMRITFKPTASGQCTYKFKLENKNDSSNYEIIVIHASVTAEQQVELLQVGSATSFDMGDCYSDMPNYGTFTIKNISEESVDINLGCDLEAEQVSFHLHDADSEAAAKARAAKSKKETPAIGEHRGDAPPDTPADTTGSTAESIEELSLNPGAERTIQIRYCPKPAFAPTDPKAFHLTPRSFRLLLRYGGSALLKNARHKNKTVKVSSRVCTSAISIPAELDLGDCTVGMPISRTIHVQNLSELATTVSLRFQSKVIGFKTTQVHLPAKQTVDLHMDFLPRKNNPEYRKQITLINANNSHNDQYLEVRANNADEASVSVHAKYYHLETPFSRNYIDFDEVIVNCPSLRTFSVKNTSKAPLTLALSTSLPDEIKVYRENTQGEPTALPSLLTHTRQTALHDYVTKFFEGEDIEPIGAKPYARKVNSQYLDLAVAPKAKAQAGNASQQTPQLAQSQQQQQQQLQPSSAQSIQQSTKKKSPYHDDKQQTTSTTSSTANSRTNSRASSPTFEAALDKQLHAYDDIDYDNTSSSTALDSSSSSVMSNTPNSNFSFTQLVQSFEDSNLPLFTDFESETNYITSQIEKYKRLEIIVQSGQLVQANTIELARDEEITIYIVFIVNDSKRPWLGGKLKNMESKLFISLQKLDDQDITNSPIRELIISTKVCKSMMDLAQRNINFGNIVQYDYRTKTLVINNLTQVPLIYRIKKSGSITSGNLNIVNVDRMGIIRPFRKREVQFVFKPTFSGIFDEKMTIENIYDNGNNQTVHIKANVKKPRHFFLNTLDIDFGVCMIKSKSMTKRITLTNTSTQKRIFKIIDDTPASFESCLNKLYFRLEERAALSISKETEVEIDLLERKLKICRRKGQHEKALKINMQIEKLRNTGTPSAPSSVPVSRATSPAPMEIEQQGELSTSNELIPALSVSGGDKEEEVTTPKPFCKIGDNSIQFEVDGGGIQNILVHFSPIPKPGRRQWYGKEDGAGSILVYESKNIDITKKINYTSTICFDDETYRSNVLSSSLSDAFGNSANSPTGQQSIMSPVASPKLPTTVVRPVAKPSVNLPTILTIAPGKIDLGEVRVYEDIPFRFALVNHTGYKVAYELTVPQPPTSSTSTNKPPVSALVLKEKTGFIEPYGRKNIEAVCQPQIPGKQTHSIAVRSSSHTYEGILSVTLSPRPPQYVLFPDLPSSSILDFGDCYYDKSKKFSKTAPFRLDNLSHSNLSMQIFVFQDDKFTKPADNIFMKGHEKTVVYVCLQPSMTSENYVDGHCREIVGGIRIKVQDTEYNVLFENTIKFTAIVGKSIIRVGKTLIDLGSTRSVGEAVGGSFNVANLTTLLPLQYTLTASKNLKLSRTEGTLDGAETTHGVSKERIHFTLHTTVFGLYEERITINNKCCAGQRLEVLVRLLVDDSALLTNLPLNSNSCDFLKFDDIYVTPAGPVALLTEEARRTTEFSIAPSYVILASFTMRNFLKYDIRIYPKSNLNLTLVLHEGSATTIRSSDEGNSRGKATDKRKMMRLCGKPFILSSDQKIAVQSRPPDPESTLTAKKKTLLWKGRKVQFQGTLVFERSDSTHYPIGPGEGRTHISKLVAISGTYCMSLGSISETTVDIGRVGYENSWKEVIISLDIQNMSEIPLVLRAPAFASEALRFSALPISITTNNDGSIGFQIAPSETKQVAVALDPRKIEGAAGLMAFPVIFENLHNPHNTMRCEITLVHTLRVLNFGRLTEGALNIPTLYHPPLVGTSAQSDDWFTIENTSNRSLKLTVDVELATPFDSLISAELVHRSSNAPIPSFSLRPAETIEVRVRAKPRSDSRLTANYEGPVVFGQISVATNLYPVEIVQLKGTLVAGHTFSLSVPRLTLNAMTRIATPAGDDEQRMQSSLTDNFKVRNTSSHFPLRFRAEIQTVGSEIFEGLRVSVSPEEGEVLPNESMTVDVNVDLPAEDMPPRSSFNVAIISLDSFNKETQRVLVNLIGGNKPISVALPSPAVQSQPSSSSGSETPPAIQLPTSTTPTLQQSQQQSQQQQSQQPQPQQQIQPTTPTQVAQTVTPNLPPPPPRISLKGCTPVSKSKNCFEINLNQQEFASGSVQWELTLENVSGSSSLEYHMFTSKTSDEQWFQMSRNAGRIEPHGRHNITLTFATKRMDMHSAYLIVENRNNPGDQKTIHITMDVVARQNTHFTVWVDGRQNAQPVIDLGDVFYNATYTDRSFIVSNTSSMPLDFMITTSLLPVDTTEVCFSLSRSYLRSFNSLYVDANSSVKVFIFLHPSAPPSEPVGDIVTQKEIKILTVKEMKLKKSFEANTPLLSASTSTSIKSSSGASSGNSGNGGPSASGKKVDIDFHNESRDIVLYNNFGSSTSLNYVVRSKASFFIIDCAEEGSIDGDSSTVISIQPNIPVILENASLLLKEKYLEEHIIIYNKSRLSEKYIVSLRITIGNLTAFSSSSGLKGGYHYRNLENLITRFTRKFKKFWFRVMQQAGSIALPSSSEAEAISLASTEDTPKSIEKLKELIEMGCKNDRYPILEFELHHITNELILFGLKKQINELKSTSMLQSCIHSLGEFLSYFPEKREDLAELRSLQDLFSKKSIQSPEKSDDEDGSSDDDQPDHKDTSKKNIF
eukprot:gene11912-13878_t